jgi:hypothetical protein
MYTKREWGMVHHVLMAHGSVQGFATLAGQWNLGALRTELTQLLEQFSENERPYVATHLERALDMFLDAYNDMQDSRREES